MGLFVVDFYDGLWVGDGFFDFIEVLVGYFGVLVFIEKFYSGLFFRN